jgi:hypothetical protein
MRSIADLNFFTNRSKDYVTLIVEVGYLQAMSGAHGLRAKAREWFNQYPTVVYVVLVHISKKLQFLQVYTTDRERGVREKILLLLNLIYM